MPPVPFIGSRKVGDRTFYLNLETRVELFSYRIYLFPGKVGLLGLWDQGRVRTKQIPGKEWLQSHGGGIWFSLADRFVVSATMARSTFGSYVHFQKGFFF
ncbi:hypothetical protein GCM10011405_12680 [Rufibacter glacialis]|nr:hypothetical protein GCM10011405_12680 [Rufibacter glacialis]